jgi:hypothetical protein
MSEPETAQARQAALMVYGLPPAAGRQVLARLAPAEQRRLRPLLEELAAMGLESASSVALAGHLSGSGQPDHGATEQKGHTAQVRAAALAPDVVERCLQACSPAMVAVLLRSATWPWRDRVLDLMPQPRRAAVREAMQCSTVTPASAVLAMWCERLCEQAEELQRHDLCASRPWALPMRASISTFAARLRRIVAWKR